MTTLYPLTKVCNKCGIEKPMSEFRRNSNGRGIGGRRAQCKDCQRVYHREYNNSFAGQIRSEKYRKTAKAHKTWRRNNKTKAGRAAQKRYCKANPKKRKAKDAVNSAIKAGKLPPVSTDYCTRCGAQAEHYHHWSYEPQYWLDVIPVCQSCHVTIHKRMPS